MLVGGRVHVILCYFLSFPGAHEVLAHVSRPGPCAVGFDSFLAHVNSEVSRGLPRVVAKKGQKTI